VAGHVAEAPIPHRPGLGVSITPDLGGEVTPELLVRPDGGDLSVSEFASDPTLAVVFEIRLDHSSASDDGWTIGRTAAHRRNLMLDVLLDGLGIPESPRWHDGRLWFCDWGAAEVRTLGVDGRSQLEVRVPTSLPISIDWLPDGAAVVSGREASCFAGSQAASS
jgi:hypothetical protein